MSDNSFKHTDGDITKPATLEAAMKELRYYLETCVLRGYVNYYNEVDIHDQLHLVSEVLLISWGFQKEEIEKDDYTVCNMIHDFEQEMSDDKRVIHLKHRISINNLLQEFFGV